MKVILSSTVTLAILAVASSTDTEGNKLANCFSRCEAEWGTGSAANPCRSNCRGDETWSGRDYKNRRNPDSRNYRGGSRSNRYIYDDAVSNWDEDPDEAVVDTLNKIMAFSMPAKDDDDDDDDDDKTRTIVLPQCVVDGLNYQRCAPGSMLATDEKTCKEIDDTVCKKPATEANEAYCECIGLGKRSTLLHSVIKKQVVNKGAVANAVKHFMTLTENDDKGGDDGDKDGGDDKDSGDDKDDGGDDKDDGDDENDVKDDDKDQPDDDEKDKEDDDDDKKNKDDDDDDDKTRTVVLPTCVVNGQNYQRCASGLMLATDEKSCKEIDDTLCKKADKDDEAYCQCIGLGKRSTLLRGVLSPSL